MHVMVETTMEECIRQGQHYYCFLCSTLIQDSPPPPTPLAAEQIALCKDFLNEIDPTNYVENNNSQSKCCHNCVPGIQQVWDLNQDILIIRRRIVNILSELGRRRHEDVVLPSTPDSNPNPGQTSSRVVSDILDIGFPFIKLEAEGTSQLIDTTENEINILQTVFTGGPATPGAYVLPYNLNPTEDEKPCLQAANKKTPNVGYERVTRNGKSLYVCLNKPCWFTSRYLTNACRHVRIMHNASGGVSDRRFDQVFDNIAASISAVSDLSSDIQPIKSKTGSTDMESSDSILVGQRSPEDDQVLSPSSRPKKMRTPNVGYKRVTRNGKSLYVCLKKPCSFTSRYLSNACRHVRVRHNVSGGVSDKRFDQVFDNIAASIAPGFGLSSDSQPIRSKAGTTDKNICAILESSCSILPTTKQSAIEENQSPPSSPEQMLYSNNNGYKRVTRNGKDLYVCLKKPCCFTSRYRTNACRHIRTKHKVISYTFSFGPGAKFSSNLSSRNKIYIPINVFR
ncbi:uncharacterized protein LOC110841847 isoform X2 [Folsomia candida]|uniref:uncharacterized protein LOC110841847 isoform X2 n=1 Tax=Folsomia candida TaxID=158441 RepID=UPI001604B5BE|nr:uncharacterized protein LOC110841847 isoform X2 [Folsomia candida]